MEYHKATDYITPFTSQGCLVSLSYVDVQFSRVSFSPNFSSAAPCIKRRQFSWSRRSGRFFGQIIMLLSIHCTDFFQSLASFRGKILRGKILEEFSWTLPVQFRSSTPFPCPGAHVQNYQKSFVYIPIIADLFFFDISRILSLE